MATKIYSVFPACGKTWLYKHQKDYSLKILDSDSSKFNWVWGETICNGEYVRYKVRRNPSFPQNYIDHIMCKFESGKYDCIFVSSHGEVRDALEAAGIDFTIVYPDKSCMAEWVGRCFIRDKRGEDGCNPGVLYDNWEQWIEECVITGKTHEKIVLKAGEHLSDHIMKTPENCQECNHSVGCKTYYGGSLCKHSNAINHKAIKVILRNHDAGSSV